MMIDDKTTAIKQLIERAMLELVDLNNQGVHLLGEGRLELARTAIYHATDRIHQVREIQAQLEIYMAQEYQPPPPMNLVLGVRGHCYVTPLQSSFVVDHYHHEGSSSGGGGTTLVDHPRAYEMCPVPNLTQYSPVSVAATTSNNNTNEEQGQRASSSHTPTRTGTAAVLEKNDAKKTTTSRILVSPPVEPTTSTKAASLPLTNNNELVEQQQEQQEGQEERQSLNRSTKKEPPRPSRMITTTMMPPLFSFLRPIFFSAQDFLHVVNPPLTHLCICLLFNLAVANHKIAMTMMQESMSSLSSKNSFSASSSSASRSPSVDDDDGRQVVLDHEDDCLLRQRRQRMLVPLQEAIHWYELAFRLQMEDAGSVEVSRLHTLGIVNNLGQLYYQLGTYTASKERFETLLELITFHRVRDQGSLLLRRLNLHVASSLFSGGGEHQEEQEREPSTPFFPEHDEDGGSGRESRRAGFLQQQQQELLLLQQQEQQIQQDAPYMELFLDNIFQVLAHPQNSLTAPAA